LGGPVDVSNDFNVLFFLGAGGLFGGDDIEVPEGEFFGGVDGELVDAHLVGLGGIGVVFLDLEDVLLEDESAVGFLLGGPGDTELAFPFFEGVGLARIRAVEGSEDGNGEDGGYQDFVSHLKIIPDRIIYAI
jgi:hypothetical protein